MLKNRVQPCCMESTNDAGDFVVLKMKTACLARLLRDHHLFVEDLRSADATSTRLIKQLLQHAVGRGA